MESKIEMHKRIEAILAALNAKVDTIKERVDKLCETTGRVHSTTRADEDNDGDGKN